MESLAYLDPLSPTESEEISQLLSKEPKSEGIINPFPLYESIKPLFSQNQGVNLEKFQLQLPLTSDVVEWENTLNLGKSLLEYSQSRILELETLLTHGKEAHAKKVLFLKQFLLLKEEELLDKKKKIQELNLSRQESTREISPLLLSYQGKYKKVLEQILKVGLEIRHLETLKTVQG